MSQHPAALTADARRDEFERLMRALRLTSHDAAETLGLTYESIRMYLRGAQAPSGPALLALTALEYLPAEQRDALIIRRLRIKPNRRAA